MFANPITAWIKKFWLYLLLALVATAFLIVCLVSSKEVTDPDHEKTMAKKLEVMKDKTRAELILHDSKMKVRKREVAEIKKISDKEKRLQKLADLGNRRGS